MLALGVALACARCASQGSGPPARYVARGAILGLSAATTAGDQVCATVAKQRADLPLAKSCAGAYTKARESLLIAAGGVDAWDNGAAQKVSCAVRDAASALNEIRTGLQSERTPVPPLLVDSLALSEPIARECKQ